MKYSEEQKKRLKEKGMAKFTKYDRFFYLPIITNKDGFDIIESKMNQL